MVENDSVIADDNGAFTIATTVEPEIQAIYLTRLNSERRDELKTLDDPDIHTVPERHIKSLNCPTYPDVALIHYPSLAP